MMHQITCKYLSLSFGSYFKEKFINTQTINTSGSILDATTLQYLELSFMHYLVFQLWKNTSII